ncbi:MAG: hypothetical protein AB8E15_04855 [Bdellovibrionales bacterium]
MQKEDIKDENGLENATPADSLPSSFKKFRRLPEIEAFYRYIYENDLRKEGKQILEKIIIKRRLMKMAQKLQKKTKKA